MKAAEVPFGARASPSAGLFLHGRGCCRLEKPWTGKFWRSRNVRGAVNINEGIRFQNSGFLENPGRRDGPSNTLHTPGWG